MVGTTQRSSCSGVATLGSQDAGVWTTQPRALVTRPICSWTSTCWKALKPAPAELPGHVDGLEAELGDPAPVRLQEPVGELAAVELGLHLVRLELVGQGPGGRLDLPVGLRHRIALTHESGPPGVTPNID
jgi:hypothetical protein